MTRRGASDAGESRRSARSPQRFGTEGGTGVKKKEQTSFFSFLRPKGNALDNISEFAMFVRMLAYLVNSGMTPQKAMTMMHSKSSGAERKRLDQVMEHMNRGETLAESFAATGYYPKEFSGIISIGEREGKLYDALMLYGDYITHTMTLRRSFSAALKYPSFVLAFLVGAVLALTLKVLPNIVTMVNGMGISRDKLPSVSRLLFILTDMVNFVGVPVATALSLALIAYIFTGGQKHLIALLSKVPKVGDMNNRLSWAQWLLLGATCFSGGMKVYDTVETLSNMPLPKELAKKGVYQRMKENIRAGRSLSEELERAKAPGIITQMIAMAERSGTLGESMRSVANQYLFSLSYEMKELSSMIEPIVIGMVTGIGGGFVGIVFITMYSVSRLAAR